MSARESAIKIISRNWPFENGTGRLIDRFAKFEPSTTEETFCYTSANFGMYVMPNDLIGRHIAISGKFDQSIVNTLLMLSDEDDVVVDVGANIGYVSCSLLQSIKNSKVFCVEPQPRVARLLRRNLEQFGQNRSEVSDIALSDSNGTVRMSLMPGNTGGSSVSICRSSDTIDVACRHSGEYFSQFNKVDLIKIDVEGHEGILFSSAEDEIKRLHPKAIVFECHGADASPGGSIGKILRRCGYDIYSIRKTVFATTYYKVKCAKDCISNDYVAVSVNRSIPQKAMKRL